MDEIAYSNHDDVEEINQHLIDPENQCRRPTINKCKLFAGIFGILTFFLLTSAIVPMLIPKKKSNGKKHL